MNDLMAQLKETETHFPKNFADFEEREYGIFFYDLNNPDSYDSNHAVLHKEHIGDLTFVLREISRFYLSKQLTPRIYQIFDTGFFEKEEDIFTKCGYELETGEPVKFYLLDGENLIQPKDRLSIRRLREWNDRIGSDIFLPADKEYTAKVIRRALKDDNFHFYAGFLEKKMVCCASVYRSAYGMARLDNVETAADFRRNGYMGELMSHIVGEYASAESIPLYEWPASEEAQRVYERIGFRKLIFEAENVQVVYKGDQE